MFFFHKRKSLIERVQEGIDAIIISTGIVLYWRGIWMIADVYLFPDSYFLSAIVSFVGGVLILLLTKSFLYQLVGDDEDDSLL